MTAWRTAPLHPVRLLQRGVCSRSGLAGFTFLELVIVVGLLALLFSIGIPSLKGLTPKSRPRTAARETPLPRRAGATYSSAAMPACGPVPAPRARPLAKTPTSGTFSLETPTQDDVLSDSVKSGILAHAHLVRMRRYCRVSAAPRHQAF